MKHNSRAKAQNQKGNQFKREGKLEQAIACYQKALELDPEDAISHNNLGLVLGKMGNHKKAEKHYADAEKIDPKNFAMSKSSENKPGIAPEVKPTAAPLPSIKNQAENKENVNFAQTVKKLITSSNERKEFWEFVKDKIFK